MSFWYISYADDDHGGFLGGVCVEAPDCIAATTKVTQLGIDPGGESLAFDITEFGIPPYPLDTLLTKDAMAEIDGGTGLTRGEMSDEMRDIVDARGHKTRALSS